jgi:hypothetical protein
MVVSSLSYSVIVSRNFLGISISSNAKSFESSRSSSASLPTFGALMLAELQLREGLSVFLRLLSLVYGLWVNYFCNSCSIGLFLIVVTRHGETIFCLFLAPPSCLILAISSFILSYMLFSTLSGIGSITISSLFFLLRFLLSESEPDDFLRDVYPPESSKSFSDLLYISLIFWAINSSSYCFLSFWSFLTYFLFYGGASTIWSGLSSEKRFPLMLKSLSLWRLIIPFGSYNIFRALSSYLRNQRYLNLRNDLSILSF